MAKHLGIWHATTVESAKNRQRDGAHPQTLQTTTVIGHKRTLNEVQRADASGQPGGQTAGRRVAAALLPKESPKVEPGAIEWVDEGPLGPSEYSQRKAFAVTPSSTADPLLSLSHPLYDLPEPLVANFAALGIHSIYPWQKQCLLGPGLLSGERNLVYSAPTGGGKSLVADVLLLRRVLEDREAKALLVLPYVALVQEKVRWLRNMVQGISRAAPGQESRQEQRIWTPRADKDSLRVVGFYGGNKVKVAWADFGIAVCTIEKANQLVNTAIDDCTISTLKVVVVDELHMIDDEYRGYLIELMATKLLCLDHHVQIVGMSATLSNIHLLKTWLQGHSYETRYKPVPIHEHLVYDGRVYSAEGPLGFLKTAGRLRNGSQSTLSKLQPLKVIKPSSQAELKDPVLNAVVALARETVQAGYGVLVFASSRNISEADAVIISRALPGFREASPSVQEQRLDLLNDLRTLNTGLDANLEKTIPAGVAGLTTEERELVAEAFDKGVVKVCVATASLAAGINLPARRVILHNVRMGRDLVGPSMLRQMRGRAGRKGKDEVGETYLCCRKADIDEVIDLMQADLPQISSCLLSQKRQILRALLEVIAVRLATSRDSLDEYIGKTMLFHSAKLESIQPKVQASIDDLLRMGFITVDKFDNFQVLQLGKAVVASGLDPGDGLFVHGELQRALKAFVLDGEMHVLYTFTPVHNLSNTNINWRVFWDEMEQLDESGMRVMNLLGLKPVVLNRMLHGGTMKEITPEDRETARRYFRFYQALMLRDLCNEVPVHRVAVKYEVPRGMVQNLGQTCQGFAAGMIKFCDIMDWGVMAAALDHFFDRLKAGAKSDLLALAKITFVKSRTARVFWDNGFKTVAAVANADPKELVPVLMQAQPNKIRLKAKDEDKYCEKMLTKAKVIAESANRIWQMQMQQDLDDE